MNTVGTTTAIALTLLGAVLAGVALRRRLPENHLSADSKDAVKLAMGLVATMTALLLGLLVSSAKGTYDAERSEVTQMAAKIAFLDRVLSLYGPDAAEVRAGLRDMVAGAVRSIWPGDEGVPAELRPNPGVGEAVYIGLSHLTPRDDMQRDLKAHALAVAAELATLRMQLVAQAIPSIPMTLVIAVVSWLVLLFLGFSLLAPPNGTTAVALVAAAVSVTGAIFLILELDQPFSGVIRVSSLPLLETLQHLAR